MVRFGAGRGLFRAGPRRLILDGKTVTDPVTVSVQ
jgi:hypothetical protein